jgi:hypothetical protein
MRKVAYHGTPHAGQVLREGLIAAKALDGQGGHSCPHIWLARKPEDAESSGEVLEVDMTGIPGDFEPRAWQGCYHGGDLEPWRLRRYVPLGS